MAFTYLVNLAPIDSTDGVFHFLTTAVTAGWTVTESSDGISSYTPGNPSGITQSRISTGGLQNPKAWFVIQQPGSTRQFSIQRSANDTTINYNFRILYSPAAGFTGGSPGIVQTPTASDEVIILGGGTEAAPTFGQYCNTDSARWHYMFGDSSANYGFTSVSFLLGTSITCQGFMLDIMAANSYPSADLDPVIIYKTNSGQAYGVEVRNSNTGPVKGYLGSLSPSSFVSIQAPTYTSPGGSIPSTFPSNIWSGREDILPVYYVRGISPFGFKGYSSIVKYLATPRGNSDLVSINSVKDHICVGPGFLLPWSGVDVVI